MSRKKRRRKPRTWVHPRKAMWLKQNYRCGICKKTIRWKHLFTDKVNVDHIRPRAHGGKSFPDNLQVTHKVCNQKKADSCEGCEVCYQWNGNPEDA